MLDFERFIQAIVEYPAPVSEQGPNPRIDIPLVTSHQWLRLWNDTLATWDAGEYQSDPYQLAQRVKAAGVDPRLHDGRLDQAAVLGHFLLTIGELSRDPRIRALGWLARGDVAREQGRMGEAMAACDAAASESQLALDAIGWARARSGWLISATYAGQVTEDDIRAMDPVSQSLQDAHEYLRLASVEQNIGAACQELTEYTTALRRFDRGLAALGLQQQLDRRQRHDRRNLPREKPLARWNYEGMLLANKATTLLYLGKLTEAEHCFLQARRRFRCVENLGLAAQVQVHLALIARSRGQLASGLPMMRGAIAQLRAVDLKLKEAFALTSYAKTLLNLNRSQEACSAATQAVELMAGLQQSPLDLADALVLQARTLGAAGNAAQGEICLDAAENLLHAHTADHPWHLHQPISLERAWLRLQQRRYSEARELALTLLRPGAPNVMEMHRAEAHLIAAHALLAQGWLTLARLHADRVVLLGEAQHMPEIAYQGHVVLAQVAKRCEEPGTALEHFDLATRALHVVLDDLVFDQRPGFLEEKESVYLEALALALEYGHPTGALVYLERSRARGLWRVSRSGHAATDRQDVQADGTDSSLEDAIVIYNAKRQAAASMHEGNGPSGQLQGQRLQKELRDLETQIRNRTEEVARRVGKATLPDTATLLAAAHAGPALAYALAGDNLVIFVLHGGSIDVRTVARGAGKIRQLTHGAILAGFEALAQRLTVASHEAGQLHRIADIWGRSLRADLAQLWELLIAPVEREGWLPPDGAVLTIVPHDVLHALPLAALYDAKHSCYLVERWATERATSCLILARQTAVPGYLVVPESRTTKWDRTMLALGYSNHGELPQSPREADELATLLGGQAYVEAEATSTQLRVHGPGSRFLHFSTHGSLYETNPTFSHLLLADGPLYGSMIRRLHLSGCELVSLSACDTGCGQPCRGDEFVGLVRDFGFAGVRAVLASLWSIEEGLTRELLQNFYRRLSAQMSASTVGPPLVLSQALRAAQLEMLSDRANSLRSSPYAWGGLALTSFPSSDLPDAVRDAIDDNSGHREESQPENR